MQRKRILVLDRDDALLLSLEQCLEDEGFDTTITWDAREALALLSSKYFDAVVLGDPAQFHLSEILTHIYQIGATTPCIVLLADRRDRSRFQQCSSLAARAVLGRWEHGEVVNIVREALRAAA
jgi:DNA-binding response OmpR family regulator